MEDTTGHQYQNLSIKGSSKAVLVTGGAGYVGSHTCKLLAKNGYLPITVDRPFREGLVSFGPNHKLVLPQEVDRLDEIIHRYNITSCIHFAGSTSVPESVTNPSLYYKNNLQTTYLNLDNWTRTESSIPPQSLTHTQTHIATTTLNKRLEEVLEFYEKNIYLIGLA